MRGGRPFLYLPAELKSSHYLKGELKMSSKPEQQKSEDKGRVEVENLPRKEEELKNEEAKRIRGGGAADSGVNLRHIGEEIPQ